MKKCFVFTLISLTLFSCEEDCPIDDVKSNGLPKLIYDSAYKCHPTIYELNTNDISFLPDSNFQTIIYLSDNDTFDFNFYLYKDTTISNCYFGYHSIQLVYETNSPIGEIIFALNPFYSGDSLNYEIIIGPPGQFGCQSLFQISTENDLPDVGSVQILDKTFYDVYYRTMPTFCCTEMYYNKQYGVVGFKWMNEWYALDN